MENVRFGTLFLVAVLLAACTTATVDVTGEAVQLAGSGTVAISASDKLESNATVSCVANALSEAETHLRVISADKFREEVFGGEAIDESETVLVERLMGLKDAPRYRARLSALGTRYIVLVDAPETDQSFGNFACEGAYAGFVCAATWNRNSTILARTVDLEKGAEVGSVSANVSGKRVLLLPLPIYIPVATEGEACAEIGRTLASQLSGTGDAKGTDAGVPAS